MQWRLWGTREGGAEACSADNSQNKFTGAAARGRNARHAGTWRASGGCGLEKEYRIPVPLHTATQRDHSAPSYTLATSFVGGRRLRKRVLEPVSVGVTCHIIAAASTNDRHWHVDSPHAFLAKRPALAVVVGIQRLQRVRESVWDAAGSMTLFCSLRAASRVWP